MYADVYSISMKKHSFIQVLLRGMAMGAADVVPGVSGGTMALITGIYQRLIDAVGSITADLLPTLRKEGLNKKGITAAWKAIDGTFLVAVASGILLSVLSLARVLSWALDAYPPVVWAFFVGLIAASTVVVLRGVKQWNVWRAFLTVFFAAALVAVSVMTPASTPDESWFVFISGMIAISAMILPGISGSFILVLLGKYEYVLNAVHDLNIGVLVIFALGCGIGILTSARIISWLFEKYHDSTMAAIVGIMIGSLYTVWPWRQATRVTGEYGTEEFKVLTDQPVMPAEYAADPILGVAATAEPYVLASVVACVVGIILVYAIQKVSNTVTIDSK